MSIHDSGHPVRWRVFSEPKAHGYADQNSETAAGLTRFSLAHRSGIRTGGIWAVLPSGRGSAGGRLAQAREKFAGLPTALDESTWPLRMKNARMVRFVHDRSPGYPVVVRKGGAAGSRAETDAASRGATMWRK